MNDLTIIYLTRNEHPQHWTQFHWEKLKEAAGNYPIIKVSPEKDADIQDIEPPSHYNMYRQLLKACKLATTPYIATAESDTLYPREHFEFHRPAGNAVAYDFSRWLLYTWGSAIYSLKQRISNCTLIAPREFYIDALEEHYGDNSPFPKDDRICEVGRKVHETALGLTRHKVEVVWCTKPTIQVNHPNGTNFKQAHHPTRKNLGELRAFDLEVWGRAEDLIKEYR